MTLGRKIKLKRELLGLSKKELAESSNACSANQITTIESGGTKYPSPSAYKLHFTLDMLIKRDPKKYIRKLSAQIDELTVLRDEIWGFVNK